MKMLYDYSHTVNHSLTGAIMSRHFTCYEAKEHMNNLNEAEMPSPKVIDSKNNTKLLNKVLARYRHFIRNNNI